MPTEPFRILVAQDTTLRGPFTHDELPLAGETAVVLTEPQKTALNTLRAAQPGAQLAFDGVNFALSPGELARRAQRQEQRSLLDKLAADTLTAAELRTLVKHLVRRLRQVESKIAAPDE